MSIRIAVRSVLVFSAWNLAMVGYGDRLEHTKPLPQRDASVAANGRSECWSYFHTTPKVEKLLGSVPTVAVCIDDDPATTIVSFLSVD